MDDFPSNSKRVAPNAAAKKTAAPRARKEEKPAVQAVVPPDAVTKRKKSLGKRFNETFFSGEDFRTVISHVFMDVMIPAAKDTISDAVSESVQRALFGESPSRAGRVRGAASRSQIAYNRVGGSGPLGVSREAARPALSRRAQVTHSFDELIYQEKYQADEVLSDMFNLLSQYGVVTVEDFYTLSGQTPSFTDNKFGWESLEGSRPVRVHGGAYVLDLPPTIELP